MVSLAIYLVATTIVACFVISGGLIILGIIAQLFTSKDEFLHSEDEEKEIINNKSFIEEYFPTFINLFKKLKQKIK